MRFLRLKLPAWPLEVDDTVALTGLVLVGGGTWAEYGAARAALVSGGLLLLGYALRELLALIFTRPRS